MLQPLNDDLPTLLKPSLSGDLPTRLPDGHTPAYSSDEEFVLPVGTRLAEFEIQDKIGEGGFSTVYQAWDHVLRRQVALKEYFPSSIASRSGQTQVCARSQRHKETFAAGLDSFIKEAQTLASFDHPSLVKVLRFFPANGTAYMVMPLYVGTTFRDAVRAMPEPPDEAWLLAQLDPLTLVLQSIHAQGWFHRDIAPDNIMLIEGGNRPLLLDFGAARRVISDLTQALTVILKPGYAPVEQYAEVPGMKQGAWTDVYALAATVYWAITGKTPPTAVGRMVNDTLQPLTKSAAGRYSPRFLSALDEALKVRPSERTSDMTQFRLALGFAANTSPVVMGNTVVASGNTTVTHRSSVSESSQQSWQTDLPIQHSSTHKNSLTWIVAGLTLLVAVGVAFYSGSRNSAIETQRVEIQVQSAAVPSASSSVQTSATPATNLATDATSVASVSPPGAVSTSMVPAPTLPIGSATVDVRAIAPEPIAQVDSKPLKAPGSKGQADSLHQSKMHANKPSSPDSIIEKSTSSLASSEEQSSPAPHNKPSVPTFALDTALSANTGMPDWLIALRTAMARCEPKNFIEKVLCNEQARWKHCEPGRWNQVPECHVSNKSDKH